jgi:hypothetical protein
MAQVTSSDESQARSVVSALERLYFDGAYSDGVNIHILGADEVELPSLKESDISNKWFQLFDHVQSHGGTSLTMLFLGPNMRKFQDNAQIGLSHQGLSVKIEAMSGCYHECMASSSFKAPLLAVAYNAGLWGYDSWLPTLTAIFTKWQQNRAHNYLLITSYTHAESEDDYDTMQTAFDAIGGTSSQQQRSVLQWHWDCEHNPHHSTEDLNRKGSPDGSAYKENQYWQCVSVETPA